MEKKYIEFILENQEHMKKIEELEKISREYRVFLPIPSKRGNKKK